MLARFEQPTKACSPIDITLPGIVILVKLAQRANAEFPILVKLFPIDMLVKFVQLSKAKLPIEVTLSGIVILVMPEQLPNA